MNKSLIIYLLLILYSITYSQELFCYDEASKVFIRGTLSQYDSLLNLLTSNDRFEILTQEELYEYNNPAKIAISFRHDIDGDFIYAYKMALIERKYGVRATYYILHTRSTYRYYEGNLISHNDSILDKVLLLQNLGHEIGLHNNLITLQILYEYPPRKYLFNELSSWKLHNIFYSGSAAHGDYICSIYKYINYYIWDSLTYYYPNLVNSTLNMTEYYIKDSLKYYYDKLNMKEYDLKYEAYTINSTYYLSDCSGDNYNPITDFDIRKLKPGDKVIYLLHPCRWIDDLNILNLDTSFIIKIPSKYYVINSDIIKIPIIVNKLLNVQNLKFSIEYDTNRLNYLGFDIENTLVSRYGTLTFTKDKGFINLNWYVEDSITIDTQSVLIYILFKYQSTTPVKLNFDIFKINNESKLINARDGIIHKRFLLGDFNNDNEINYEDLYLFSTILVKSDHIISYDKIYNLDLDNNKEISVNDLLVLYQYLNNYIDTLPYYSKKEINNENEPLSIEVKNDTIFVTTTQKINNLELTFMTNFLNIDTILFYYPFNYSGTTFFKYYYDSLYFNLIMISLLEYPKNSLLMKIPFYLNSIIKNDTLIKTFYYRINNKFYVKRLQLSNNFFHNISYDNLNIKIYPNPTNDFVIINIKPQIMYNLKLMDIQGRIIYTGKNIKFLNLSGLQGGIYIISITTQNKNFYFKLLKLD